MLPNDTEKLYAIEKELQFLYDLHSQPNGALELSSGGEEGLCWFIASIYDQVHEVNLILEREEKRKNRKILNHDELPTTAN